MLRSQRGSYRSSAPDPPPRSLGRRRGAAVLVLLAAAAGARVIAAGRRRRRFQPDPIVWITQAEAPHSVVVHLLDLAPAMAAISFGRMADHFGQKANEDDGARCGPSAQVERGRDGQRPDRGDRGQREVWPGAAGRRRGSSASMPLDPVSLAADRDPQSPRRYSISDRVKGRTSQGEDEEKAEIILK